MIEQIKALCDPDAPLYSNLANASAVLWTMGNVNWCGFYLAEGETLYVGPFQGEVACVRIPFGKGVCGTAAKEKRTVVVPDVRLFPGHIACSEKSRSEIVVPIFLDGNVVAVIDVDAPVTDRFGAKEQAELEEIAGYLSIYFKRG